MYIKPLIRIVAYAILVIGSGYLLGRWDKPFVYYIAVWILATTFFIIH